MPQACWRDLRSYKYQLVSPYELTVPVHPPSDIVSGFVGLTAGGRLAIRKGYAWDGPSGPTIDTKNFMRGSLVHDALYQLMRLGKLDYRAHRKAADEILKRICLEDGMSGFRASYVYLAVQWFAGSHAKPGLSPADKVVCMPGTT
jgi:hypothetical protein